MAAAPALHSGPAPSRSVITAIAPRLRQLPCSRAGIRLRDPDFRGPVFLRTIPVSPSVSESFARRKHASRCPCLAPIAGFMGHAETWKKLPNNVLSACSDQLSRIPPKMAGAGRSWSSTRGFLPLDTRASRANRTSVCEQLGEPSASCLLGKVVNVAVRDRG